MTLLTPFIRLPPDLLSYSKHSRIRSIILPAPIITVYFRTARCLANHLPTSRLADIANQILNLVESTVTDDRYRVERCRQKLISQLEKSMEVAPTLADYENCTTQLDMLQGHDIWKATRESIEPSYNPAVIEQHLEELRAAAQKKELEYMLRLLRTSLSRDLGGMNMLRLYKHSWFGTKRLIDEYINTAVAAIDQFPEVATLGTLPTAEASRYQNSLEDALKYFGRSALTLSGGGLLGMKHIGVVKALWEAELLPEIISGASAGSIVAAIAGSSTDEEMEKVLDYFPNSDLAVFDAPGTGLFGWCVARVRKFLQGGTFFDIENLERVMKAWLKDLTFREAHYKTGRVLSIAVSSAENSEPRILNYVTAPDVYIWSAVCASCSVPGIFKAATIYEKDPTTKEQKIWMQHSRQLFVDGSLDHDIPMRKLSEMFNVNYFLVTQVNPHVRLFLEGEEQFKGVQPTTRFPKRSLRRWSMDCFGLMLDEWLFIVQQASNLGCVPEWLFRFHSVFKQQYTGDINILPEIRSAEYLTIMANPTTEYMCQATADGERATWPKMCRIKNSVAIELALIKAIREFREQVNFGPEAIETRRAARSSSRGRSRSARRPNFLRRRSLSNDYTGVALNVTSADGPPSPLPMRTIRRNASAGSLIERLERLTSGSEPKELAPQAGLEGDASIQSEDTEALTRQVSHLESSHSVVSLVREVQSLLEFDQPTEEGPLQANGSNSGHEASSTSS